MESLLLPLTKTDRVESFWLMKEQKRVFYLTKFANLNFERELLQNHLSSSSSSTNVRPATTDTSRAPTITKNVRPS
ncbi:hypothetical protein HPULCUR_002836 [Helicostylum pulchrum]|uniref:Uncharacterized protein n=1 Tax=Helicostylum pulchrum TaxID=562976 RepID=A0ABP9XTM3_9FUNG